MPDKASSSVYSTATTSHGHWPPPPWLCSICTEAWPNLQTDLSTTPRRRPGGESRSEQPAGSFSIIPMDNRSFPRTSLYTIARIKTRVPWKTVTANTLAGSAGVVSTREANAHIGQRSSSNQLFSGLTYHALRDSGIRAWFSRRRPTGLRAAPSAWS